MYSEAALKLIDIEFCKRLFDTGASVLPKCDSLFNEEYQNRIVRSLTREKESYFYKRNMAIENLISVGFNVAENDGTTRMGFDMVLSEENYEEVEKTLRYCRDRNLYIMFGFHLTSGRTKESANTEILKRQEISKIVQQIDKSYGIVRESHFNNFLTGPCKEYLMVRGDGRVQPCPGNEFVLRNIRETSINEIKRRLIEKFPCHDRSTYSG